MNLDLHRLRGDWRFPTRIYFGPGRITELTAVCRSIGLRRPLLVTDRTLAAMPAVRNAIRSNEENGLLTGLFSDVRPNPVGQNVRDGLQAFRSGGHDGVIAFGGGSAMDTGKVVALLAGQKADIWDLEGKWQQVAPDRVAPIVAVPTTSGTGSEVGRAAVVTRSASRVKTIILHPAMMPAAVVADPALTSGLPAHLTASTGMDALAHSFEALCARFCHPMADGIAMEGIRLIRKWLPVAVRQGRDMEARTHMMAAAIMGATAFQKGLGAIHSLSHPVGAIYDTHHGLTNAVFMPYVMAFNRPAIEDKMLRLSRFLGLEPAGFQAVMRWVLELRSICGIPHTLRELGVPQTDFEELARMAAADPCTPENPLPAPHDALLQLYKDAFSGNLPMA